MERFGRSRFDYANETELGKELRYYVSQGVDRGGRGFALPGLDAERDGRAMA